MIEASRDAKEECRDVRRVNFVEDLIRDVRYTIRSFSEESRVHRSCRRHAGALGSEQTLPFSRSCMGAAAAARLSETDQLMYLTAEAPAIGGTGSTLSAPEYIEFRQMNRSFAAVGAYSTGGAAYTTGEVNLATGDRPLRVRSISVDAHLLQALGIQPEQGRFFSDEETTRWTGTLTTTDGNSLSRIVANSIWRDDRSLD